MALTATTWRSYVGSITNPAELAAFLATVMDAIALAGAGSAVTSVATLTGDVTVAQLVAQNLVDTSTAQTLGSKTLTTPKIAQIKDTNGNTIIDTSPGASAVNYLQILNAATGGAVTLKATGTDANVSLFLTSRGLGSVFLRDQFGGYLLYTTTVSSAVNYIGTQNAVTNQAPQVQALGTDTNVDLRLVAKGTGVVKANGNEVRTSVATINAQTGTTYTLVLADAGHMVTLNNASAITLTVPTNASVAFPVGTMIGLAQLGAGQVTVAGAGGVTVNSTPGLKISAQYGVANLVKYATDTWLLSGNLTT